MTGIRRLSTLIVIIAVACGGFAIWDRLQNPSIAEAHCGTWHILNKTDADFDISSVNFSKMVAPAKDNVWLVGPTKYGQPVGNLPALVFAHWDGKRLSIVDSPAPLGAYINSIAAISPTDVWAVGIAPDRDITRPLAMHWDGKIWERVPIPDTLSDPAVQTEKNSSPQSGAFNSVAATSKDDVWAVGYYKADRYEPDKPLIMHWDGKCWQSLSILTVEGAERIQGLTTSMTQEYLRTVVATSSKDALIFGIALPPDSSYRPNNQPFTLKWDGAKWRVLEEKTASNTLGSWVTKLSASWASYVPHSGDIWIIGQNVDGFWGATKSRNADKWIVHPGPSTKLYTWAVAATSQDDAWAFGGGAFPLHWNGTEWREVAGPNPDKDTTLLGAASDGPGSVWVTGWSYGMFDNADTLIAHYADCLSTATTSSR